MRIQLNGSIEDSSVVQMLSAWGRGGALHRGGGGGRRHHATISQSQAGGLHVSAPYRSARASPFLIL